MFITLMGMILAETINSAIERTVDLVTLEHHMKWQDELKMWEVLLYLLVFFFCNYLANTLNRYFVKKLSRNLTTILNYSSKLLYVKGGEIMKILLISALIATFSFSAVVDDYLDSLKQEVLKENPSFKGFDAKRGEQILLQNI